MALEPQSQAVIDALAAMGLMPFRRFEPADLRQKILAIRPPPPAVPAHPMASVTEEVVPTADGEVRVRILRPRAAAPGERMAVVLYFHGGGFFLGGIDESDHIARQIAAEADVVVVNVEYRLAPEAKFPAGVDDCYAALCWVSANAERLGIDPDRIVVTGDSAGGNLSVVLCLLSRERGGPAIRFQAPIYPGLDQRTSSHYASREANAGGKNLLDSEDIPWMSGMYLNTPEEASDWRASPLAATSYKGLPPALVITADHDPLVDEGKLYADRLAADGVEVEYACFEGTFHGFISYGPVIEVGARGMRLLCDRIRQAVA